MEFNLENPFTNFQDFNKDETETIESLFLVESDHMPSESYIKNLKARDLDISLRRQAISSILQSSGKFDPFLSYLAVNYLDRFLYSLEMQQAKPWMLRLLAIACLALAAKVRKIEFSLTDFQGDGGLVFDTQTIQRMEYLILGALEWRMRSITPFTFLSLFIALFKLKDPPLKQALKTRAIEMIFKAQNDVKLLEFKPSIIAASALLFASSELFPSQLSCFRKAVSNCAYVNKENMLQCCNAMRDIIPMEEYYESGLDTVSNLDTPVNVLDRRFSSSPSDKTIVITITTTNTTTLSPDSETQRDTERRKMIGYCNDHKSSFPRFNSADDTVHQSSGPSESDSSYHAASNKGVFRKNIINKEKREWARS